MRPWVASPFETVDCVVIGAGVVGLAVARALALAGREVIVLEAAEGIGAGPARATARSSTPASTIPRAA